MQPVVCFLTCADKKEADKIATSLLQAKLVACVKQVQVNSMFRWKGEVQQQDEILLIIDTLKERFNEVDLIVKQLHSYEEYVLDMVEVSKTNAGVVSWLQESTNNGS